MAALLANIISIIVNGFRLCTNYSSKTNYDVKKFKLPLPSVLHKKLDNCSIKDRKLLLIGDVHGCLDELNDLLDLVNSSYNQSQYLPVFVGDMINKGPKNVETLQRVRQMEHFAVRGNHDAAVLQQVLMSQKHSEYQLPPRYQWTKRLVADDIEYLKELPYTISLPDFNAIVVHAGLVPNVSLEEQKISDMIVMRNLVEAENGTFKSAELPNEGKPWASQWNGPEHVFFGHDARRKFQQYPYSTGLDTGCVYGFDLTALLLHKDGTKEFFTVPAKGVYEKPSE